MSDLTNCNEYTDKLKSLLECLVEKQGLAVAEYVNDEVMNLVNINSVDINELTNKINLINQELDSDDVQLNGILQAISDLQTATGNNTISIQQAQTAISDAISSFNQAIANERSFVESEISRIEALIPNGYDDSEIRTMIQNAVTAINGERSERVAEIARVEGLVVQNSADIALMKTEIADNTAAIATNATGLAALTTVVNTVKAELEAKINAVADCLTAIVSGIDSISCDSLAASFRAGLAAGGSSNNGL